jgi:RNA polymerase sigma-70 factor (ECF subfamily)
MSTTRPNLLGIHALGSPHARAAQEGDGAIASEVMLLFEEHHDRLLGYVLTFGLSRHDGEEIVQEVFLSLFRHLQLGRSRSNLRAWLFAVAHNLALKQRMANQRWSQPIEPDRLEWHCDPSPNPEEHAVSAQRQKRLLAIVDALPEQDRWCLYLRSEGLRYREIAKTVGISLGSVSISLSRSFGRLMRAGEL